MAGSRLGVGDKAQWGKIWGRGFEKPYPELSVIMGLFCILCTYPKWWVFNMYNKADATEELQLNS